MNIISHKLANGFQAGASFGIFLRDIVHKGHPQSPVASIRCQECGENTAGCIETHMSVA